MKKLMMMAVAGVAMAVCAEQNEVSRQIAATYAGKTAIITGAASGMGLCTAKTLAAAGATVFMVDINGEGVRKAAKEINELKQGKAYAVEADVRKYADDERATKLAIDTTGKIDLLVNYAGGNEARICQSYKPLYEQPLEVIDWGMDTNLKGPLYMSRAAMPYMVKAKGGVIVTLGSVTGFEGDANSTYSVTKGGLGNLALSLAKAGAPYGIRAFCVAPGPVLTRPGMAKMQTLLGYQSQPQEVVDFILFMASDCCPSITGTTHVIDCGRLAMGRQASTGGFLENKAQK